MSDSPTSIWAFVFIIVSLVLFFAAASYRIYWDNKWTECQKRISAGGEINNPSYIPECDHWKVAP
jgi:hypothetical protein